MRGKKRKLTLLFGVLLHHIIKATKQPTIKRRKGHSSARPAHTHRGHIHRGVVREHTHRHTRAHTSTRINSLAPGAVENRSSQNAQQSFSLF